MSAHFEIIDAKNPDPSLIKEAARRIKNGELVIFPTETVYGLGGNALDAAAVEKIFKAKGRAKKNPLIVHVASTDEAKTLVKDWTATAQKLSESFWPGPLTLVLKKNDRIPMEVTGGGPTVAIRVPSHSVALELIRQSGIPIAAPSANISGELSATKGSHISEELFEHVAMILDSGKTAGGIESTVIDLTKNPPQMLRPGLIGKKEIEHIIGSISMASGKEEAGPLPSPGMLSKHYAPKTKLMFGSEQDAEKLIDQKKRVGFLRLTDSVSDAGGTLRRDSGQAARVEILMPSDHAQYASILYDTLHELDQKHLDLIIVEPVPMSDEWLAVRDRLTRASAG